MDGRELGEISEMLRYWLAGKERKLLSAAVVLCIIVHLTTLLVQQEVHMYPMGHTCYKGFAVAAEG